MSDLSGISRAFVVIPPSGFIDITMERSKRTRGAIVSPNHSAFVGIGGMEEESEGVGGGGGRHRKDLQRDSETTKLLFDSLRAERGGKTQEKRLF